MRSSESGWHSRDLSATGLYKLGAGEFIALVEQSGLEVVRLQLLPVWQQQWMTQFAPVVGTRQRTVGSGAPEPHVT